MSTVAVELPADWDALMEELGYEPLRSFYLEPIYDEFYDPLTEVEEVNVTPAPESAPDGKPRVRYYNLGGLQSNTPFDGVNIEVTTDSDNNSTAKKFIRAN